MNFHFYDFYFDSNHLKLLKYNILENYVEKFSIANIYEGNFMEKVIIGMIIPFLGTVLGSLLVFFMRENINKKLEKLLLGFAAGIMVAAAVWSLIIPAIEQSEANGQIGWLPTSIGVVLGFVLILILDKANQNKDAKNISKNGFDKIENKSMMFFSITLHNIPEGMAVGVALAGAYFQSSFLSLSAAIMLSVGIAIQNIPEGAIVSMPLKLRGQTKFKAFLKGAYSGIVEPVSAFITFFITGFVSSILPYVLAFAAGSMLYVVVEEIIPQSQEEGSGKSLATLGFMLGFVIMLILDIALG